MAIIKSLSLFILAGLVLSLTTYSQTTPGKTMKQKATVPCTDGCEDRSPQKPITCKLTSPGIRERKATVIASLKKKILHKKELPNGFSYQFKGSDAIIDELTTFIKTERLCCDFFNFSLSVKGDGSAATLSITGPKGTKDFIKNELEFI